MSQPFWLNSVSQPFRLNSISQPFRLNSVTSIQTEQHITAIQTEQCHIHWDWTAYHSHSDWTAYHSYSHWTVCQSFRLNSISQLFTLNSVTAIQTEQCHIHSDWTAYHSHSDWTAYHSHSDWTACHSYSGRTIWTARHSHSLSNAPLSSYYYNQNKPINCLSAWAQVQLTVVRSEGPTWTGELHEPVNADLRPVPENFIRKCLLWPSRGHRLTTPLHLQLTGLKGNAKTVINLIICTFVDVNARWIRIYTQKIGKWNENSVLNDVPEEMVIV